MFGTSRWPRRRPRKNKRTKTLLEKKETVQAIKLYNNLPPCWISAPRGLLTTQGTPDRVWNVTGVWSDTVSGPERYFVQLQRDRTSVGCSQARSETERGEPEGHRDVHPLELRLSRFASLLKFKAMLHESSGIDVSSYSLVHTSDPSRILHYSSVAIIAT